MAICSAFPVAEDDEDADDSRLGLPVTESLKDRRISSTAFKYRAASSRFELLVKSMRSSEGGEEEEGSHWRISFSAAAISASADEAGGDVDPSEPSILGGRYYWGLSYEREVTLKVVLLRIASWSVFCLKWCEGEKLRSREV